MKQLRTSPNVKKSPFRRKKVLDVGCGMGFDVMAFSKAGATAYGLDRIPVEEVPNIIQGDATALPFRNASFDIVSSKLLLDQLSQREMVAFIEEAFRVLKPEGMLIAVCLIANNELQFVIEQGKDYGFKLLKSSSTGFVMEKPIV
jgi:ubiquinone/menaquinone biosynthesis C-methylase UbiE